MSHRVRAVAFFLVVALSLIVYAPWIGLLRPFPYRYSHAMATTWCRFFVWCSRTIAGIGMRVHGMENLPDEPVVLFVKHQSAWETLALMTVFPPYVWIIKREALWIPFFGWGLAGLAPIAIDRSAGRSAINQIKAQGRERLESGLSILIFPEGTRMPVGQGRRFGMGGAVLATECRAMVVPVAHNSGVFWPARKVLVRQPGCVDIVVGKPIPTAGREPEAVNAEAKAWIDQEVSRLEQTASTLPP